MSVKTLQRSFAGGEISPELLGRLDLVKYQTGISPNSRNFIIRPHGPAINRPGTDYVLETKFSAKRSVLVAFIFSPTQAYDLEFGDQYIRIHTQGGTVLEAANNITGITQANPGVVTSNAHGYSNGDWLFLSGIGGMTQLNGRFVKVANVTANTFELHDLADAAINTTTYGVYASGGTAARVYEIATPYLEADLFDLHFTQSNDVLTIVHQGYQQRELKRLGATNWTLTTISMAPTIAAPTSPAAVVGAGSGSTAYTYVCTAVASDGLEESLKSVEATVNNNLTTAGNFNNITCTVDASAIRFNVYKKLNGLYGFIGQAAAGGTFKDDNITPDMSKTPPEANDPFPSSSNWPGAVGYFQGRRWFAGTTNKPGNLWGTRSGTEKNFSFSVPTRDDDAIAVRLTARQNNTIRHLVPLTDLLLLTDGAEWKVGADNSDVLTPNTVAYRPQDYIGASNVQPVVTSGSVIYAQARGGRMREMRFSFEQNGYKTTDISIMAPHLFDNYTITSMSFARAPYQALWATRSDGILLGLTYVPEHEVLGWHHHDTENGAGIFEAVSSVPEGSEDKVSFIVRRIVNGRQVRYVERLHTRQFTALADAYFVDCGATYIGSPTTTISGLWHLEGKTVSILADGAVHPQQVVVNGSVTLQVAASVVHIGLPIIADLETLPLSFEAQALGQGVSKNVNNVRLRVDNSSAIKVGPSFGKLIEYKQRTTEPYGSPPALKSGEIKVVVSPSWGTDAAVCIRQDQPLPLSVLSMTVEVAIGG